MDEVKGIKEFYDDTVMMWADEWYENEEMMPFLLSVKDTLGDKKKVLDLGCNCGYETMRMKKIGLDVVGLDFSEKSIIEAKKRNPDINFYCDNML